MTGLTVTDLRETLDDERHHGWGYACCGDLPETKRDRLDRAIVGVANEEKLTLDELFVWSNSKYGRYLADEVNGGAPTRATVRDYLSRDIVNMLVNERGGIHA